MRGRGDFSQRWPVLCTVAALCLLVLAPVAAQESDRVVIRGAESLGDSLVPYKFYGDVRDLPKSEPWAPGMEYVVNPRRFIGEIPESPNLTTLDPLVGLQRSVSGVGPSVSLPVAAFEGLDIGITPPDPTIEVGKDHVIQIVNSSSFIIMDKAGTILAGPTDLGALGSGACANGNGDPITLYDEDADRWFMSELSQSDGQCIYISMTPDPVSGGWCQYLEPQPTDSQKYAVWSDAYIGTAQEGAAAPPVYLFDRANMINCDTARPIQRITGTGLPGLGFQAFTPADIDGPQPPPGTPGYVMRHRDTELGNQGPPNPTQDILEIWQVEVDFDNAANTSLTKLPDILVSEFDSNLCPPIGIFSCIPMPGGVPADPLLEVIMNRLIYRNFGSHETIVGVLQTDIGDFPDHSGERWFELRRNSGQTDWSLFQEGTYSPDSLHRFMAAIAMDADGNIMMGYTTSDANNAPSLAFTGRLASDPPGVMTVPETTWIIGTGHTGGTGRFGDYAQMGIDPVDGCTFWFTGEYAEGPGNNATGDNATGIATARFDDCIGSGPSDEIFADGFESGDTTVWSVTIP